MKSLDRKSQGGFSLLELLMVLVMMGILVGLAIMQVGSATTDYQRQRIAREFKIYLERARFDSVKRRPEQTSMMARLVLTGPTSFTAIYDVDGDGVMTSSERRVVDFTQRSDAVIRVSDAWSYPVVIRFNRRGHITATDGTGTDITPLFTICSDCSSGSPDITRISISKSGTVAELRAGQSPDTLPVPSNGNTSPPMRNCYVLTNANANTVCVPN